MSTLLKRDQFRELALARDQHRCVICGRREGLSVHHLLDRKLWPDGGFYLENAASLCAEHHLQAEYTTLSVEQIRQAASIKTTILPPQFCTAEQERYDKWGDQVLGNKTRLRGELFFSEACQKALEAGGVLHLFSEKVKYPKTLHFEWSPNLQNDDRRIHDLAGFVGEEVVVTTKMDGENTTIGRNYIHARSLDSRHHPSRSWVKQLHGTIRSDIPEGWRICGENLFAQHSMAYEELPSFFMVFSVWDEKDTCLSWDETLDVCHMLNLHTVPVIYRGPWDEAYTRNIRVDPFKEEGYVTRVSRRFRFAEFSRVVAKFVRKGHVQTDEFWMNRPMVPNKLREVA
jgi:hypothetical protein